MGFEAYLVHPTLWRARTGGIVELVMYEMWALRGGGEQYVLLTYYGSAGGVGLQDMEWYYTFTRPSW